MLPENVTGNAQMYLPQRQEMLKGEETLKGISLRDRKCSKERKLSKVSPSETGNAQRRGNSQRYLPQRQEMLKGEETLKGISLRDRKCSKERKLSKVSPSETGNAKRYLPQREEMLKGISLRGHFDEFTPVILHQSYTGVC